MLTLRPIKFAMDSHGSNKGIAHSNALSEAEVRVPHTYHETRGRSASLGLRWFAGLPIAKPKSKLTRRQASCSVAQKNPLAPESQRIVE